MSNITRKFQRQAMIDGMQERLDVAEAAEARAVFYIAVYEAYYGPMPAATIKAIQELIKDSKPKTKGEFYATVFGAARTVQMEEEMAAASEAQPAPVSQALADSLGTVWSGSTETLLPAPDSADTSTTEPTE